MERTQFRAFTNTFPKRGKWGLFLLVGNTKMPAIKRSMARQLPKVRCPWSIRHELDPNIWASYSVNKLTSNYEFYLVHPSLMNIQVKAYPLPIDFICAINSGRRVLCPAAWELIPTTCTSASTACCATSMGVWGRKNYMISFLENSSID